MKCLNNISKKIALKQIFNNLTFYLFILSKTNNFSESLMKNLLKFDTIGSIL